VTRSKKNLGGGRMSPVLKTSNRARPEQGARAQLPAPIVNPTGRDDGRRPTVATRRGWTAEVELALVFGQDPRREQQRVNGEKKRKPTRKARSAEG